MNARIGVVTLALFCTASVAAGRIYFYRAHLHPKLLKQQTVIHKVVILPPLLSFVEVGMKGVDSMTPESEQLTEKLSSILESELTARGVESSRAPAGDEQKFAIADLQAKFDSVRVQVLRKPNRVDQGRITLGDGISAFAPAKGVDAIAMVRGTAVKATRAKQVAVALGMGALSGFQGEIALIDARTGELLAWTRVMRSGDVSRKSRESVADSVRNALHDVPLPIPMPD
jgi:hypothetical protein